MIWKRSWSKCMKILCYKMISLGWMFWTGFDYLGELRLWHKASRLEVPILEQRRRVYLTAIICRSRWNKDQPFISCHIELGRTWRRSHPVYNELWQRWTFINGKSMGVQKKKQLHAAKPLPLNVDGCEIWARNGKVVAFDDNGKAVAEEEVHTAGSLTK
jgi:beta-galactosidase